MSRLQDKVAVITGGSSGIGLATARRFIGEGASVFIFGRRKAELEKAVAQIGGNITAVQGDASEPDDLDRLYATVERTKGKVDVLFANAGVVEHRTIDQFSAEHYDLTFDINVRGLVLTVQKALPLMRDGGSNPYRVDRRSEGAARAWRLQCQQGRSPLVHPHMDDGTEGSRHPRQHDQPRRDRYPDYR